MSTAKSLGVQELIVGASNKFTTEEQLDQMAFYWISIHGGEQAPLTIRILSRSWDVHYDVNGGSRIPRISERKARTVAELRAAGVGVRRVLMVHDNTPHSSDVFDAVLTALDPDVVFDLVLLSDGGATSRRATTSNRSLLQDIERGQKIGREIAVHSVPEDPGPEIARLALEKDYDLVVLDTPMQTNGTMVLSAWQQYVCNHASCSVCLFSLPAIPREVVDSTPTTAIGPDDRKSGRR
jgi:nucleotide-binding universal stress UspA family protein